MKVNVMHGMVAVGVALAVLAVLWLSRATLLTWTLAAVAGAVSLAACFVGVRIQRVGTKPQETSDTEFEFRYAHQYLVDDPAIRDALGATQLEAEPLRHA